jgi:hypothetical protein
MKFIHHIFLTLTGQIAHLNLTSASALRMVILDQGISIIDFLRAQVVSILRASHWQQEAPTLLPSKKMLFPFRGQVAPHIPALHPCQKTARLWRDTLILRLLDKSSAKGVYVFNTMGRPETGAPDHCGTVEGVEEVFGAARCSQSSKDGIFINALLA